VFKGLPTAMRRFLLSAALFACTAILAVSAAHAQTAATKPAETKPAEQPLRLTIGGGAIYAPSYLGSDDYDIDPLPLFDLRYADRVFLSTRDGLGANLMDTGSNWKAGPVVKYRMGRDQDDDSALRGMGDIDAAGEAGGYVHYDLRPFTIGTEIRQGFGGHDAVIGDAFVNWSTKLSDSLMLTVGPKVTVASNDFTQTYFGITPGQATRSGYRAYNPDGAFMSYGLGASLRYRLTEQLSLGGFAGIDRIAGDAADSPLVDQAGSPTQGRLGVTLGFGW
jgi:outer membrane scaffolding protein for murein synthesis (MipA/OmpV family)